MHRRTPVQSYLWVAMGMVVAIIASQPSHAQSGLRESLERLDRNGNGEIEPSEITPLARPYLERVAEARRMTLDRAYDIERWQEAARIYYALQNGVAGRDVDLEDQRTVRRFGTRRSEVMVPEFGLPEVKYPYTREDMDEADRMMWRLDRNRDGYVDRDEARRGDWTHRDPFEEDMDHDDRLSRLELGQRYARRRLLEGATDELRQKVQRVGTGVRPTEASERSRQDDSRWWMRGGNRTWLTASMISRFDSNRDGRLDTNETVSLGLPVGRIDIDRDGVLTRDELQTYLEQLQDEAGSDAEGIPTWFYERDENRDEQVEMSEFASEWTDETLEEFVTLDANGDGILTMTEVAQSRAMMGGDYVNEEAVVLPPHKTVISEIVIDENFLIADLEVELSITHTYVSYLDLYLTGPDGQRIELCTEIGGSDDHFDRTVFDDQADVPIIKARAPFEGKFKPEGVLRGQPGLSYFNEKSVHGVWQLVVGGTRSDRFGMLHRWSLSIRPQGDSLERLVRSSDENVESESGDMALADEDLSSFLGERRFDEGRGEPARETMEYSDSDSRKLKRDLTEKQIEKFRRLLDEQTSGRARDSDRPGGD